MAAKNHKITLDLDFNVEKTKLQEISTLINKDLGKGMSSGKGGSYFNNISASVNQVYKEAAQLYKMFSKPIALLMSESLEPHRLVATYTQLLLHPQARTLSVILLCHNHLLQISE